MEHSYWEVKVQGYIDNELAPADFTAVQDHVNSCEECTTQVRYIQAMKGCLKKHADSVEMPKAVCERIDNLFAKKRKRRTARKFWYAGGGLALAAAIVLALLIPTGSVDYRFQAKELTGTVDCHDCMLAKLADLQDMTLCKDGHRLGLLDESGNLWRIAADDEGRAIIKDFALVGHKVRLIGQACDNGHMIRVEEMVDQATAQRASLRH